MDHALRALYAASLGIGIVAGLAGCSISATSAPSPPMTVRAPPAASSGTLVTPGSALVVQPPRY